MSERGPIIAPVFLRLRRYVGTRHTTFVATDCAYRTTHAVPDTYLLHYPTCTTRSTYHYHNTCHTSHYHNTRPTSHYHNTRPTSHYHPSLSHCHRPSRGCWCWTAGRWWWPRRRRWRAGRPPWCWRRASTKCCSCDTAEGARTQDTHMVAETYLRHRYMIHFSSLSCGGKQERGR